MKMHLGAASKVAHLTRNFSLLGRWRAGATRRTTSNWQHRRHDGVSDICLPRGQGVWYPVKFLWALFLSNLLEIILCLR